MQFELMDDVYAINVAKSQYREGYNTGDVDRVLSVFAPEIHRHVRRPSQPLRGRCGRETSQPPWRSLRPLRCEAQRHQLSAITILGNTAFDYGWHELTLTPKDGGDPLYRRTRYLELWSKQANGEWRIS